MKKLEIVVGGDDPLPDQYYSAVNERQEKEDEAVVERPDISTVEQLSQNLVVALTISSDNNTAEELKKYHSSLATKLSSELPCIQADELERIDTIWNGLSTIYYWAIEESTTFREEPSLLARASIPEIVLASLVCKRAKIITGVLRCLVFLLRHPQSQSEVRKYAKAFSLLVYPPTEHEQKGEVEERIGEEEPTGKYGGWSALFRLTLGAMESYGGVDQLLANGMKVVQEIVLQAQPTREENEKDEEEKNGSEKVLDSLLEEILQSSFVACMLTAMERHKGNTDVTVAATEMFVLLAQQRRAAEKGGEEEVGEGSVIPVATLFCHVGPVVPYLLRAFHSHPHHLPLQTAVFEFIRAAAEHHENRLLLFDLGVYTTVASTLTEQFHKMDLFKCSIEIMIQFVMLLDPFQSRSLILLLKETLVKRYEAEILLWALVLLYRVLTVLDRKRQPVEPSHLSTDPYAAYAMYAQSKVPSASTRQVEPVDGNPIDEKRKEIELTLSPLIICAESNEDLWIFMNEKLVPQVLMNLLEYYNHQRELEDVDKEEQKIIKKLCDVSQRCLDHMALNEAQRNQVRLNFLLLDEDSDGKIDVQLLGSFLRAVGLYPTDAEVQGVAGVVDPEGTGKVSEERAMEAVESLWARRTTEEELREAFKLLDEDADGYLTTSDLRHILVNLGLKLSSSEADEIIEVAEKDDENYINIDDFISLLLTQKPLR